MTITRQSPWIWAGLVFTALSATAFSARAVSQRPEEAGKSQKARGPREKGTSSRDPKPPYFATHRNMNRSISQLILNPAVSDELEISPKTKRKLSDTYSQAVLSHEGQQINRAFRNAFQDWRSAVYWGDPAKIAVAEQEFARAKQARAAARAARDKAALAILTPAQRKRMVQIFLRYEGIRALARPEIAEQAGLTAEQVAEFQKILADRERFLELQTVAKKKDPAIKKMYEEMDRVMAKGREHQPLSKEDFRFLDEHTRRSRIKEKERDRFERAIDAQLSRTLKRYQRARFAKMLGPEFDLRQLGQRRSPRATPKAKNKSAGKREDAEKKNGVEK